MGGLERKEEEEEEEDTRTGPELEGVLGECVSLFPPAFPCFACLPAYDFGSGVFTKEGVCGGGLSGDRTKEPGNHQ